MGGGVWIILAYEPEGSTSILWKRHIFKAVGGTIMGGAFVGVFQWGGGWGGRLLAYMAGRRGGVRYDYGAFFTSKNAIFLFGHSSEHDK